MQFSRLWRTLVALLSLLAFALALTAATGSALADGDPGSDELVYQNLFAPSDANLSTAQQLQLGRLLDATTKAGQPVRVALIPKRDDLGTVTQLWQQPQPYVNYLGTELSLSYSGRLLVVMPSGLGVYWQGSAHNAFDTLMNDYDIYARMLHDALTDIASGLRGNYVNYADSEQTNLNNIVTVDLPAPKFA